MMLIVLAGVAVGCWLLAVVGCLLFERYLMRSTRDLQGKDFAPRSRVPARRGPAKLGLEICSEGWGWATAMDLTLMLESWLLAHAGLHGLRGSSWLPLLNTHSAPEETVKIQTACRSATVAGLADQRPAGLLNASGLGMLMLHITVRSRI